MQQIYGVCWILLDYIHKNIEKWEGHLLGRFLRLSKWNNWKKIISSTLPFHPFPAFLPHKKYGAMNQPIDCLPEPMSQYTEGWLTDIKGMHCINLLRHVFLQFATPVKETQSLSSQSSQEIFFMLMQYRQLVFFTQTFLWLFKGSTWV